MVGSPEVLKFGSPEVLKFGSLEVQKFRSPVRLKHIHIIFTSHSHHIHRLFTPILTNELLLHILSAPSTDTIISRDN